MRFELIRGRKRDQPPRRQGHQEKREEREGERKRDREERPTRINPLPDLIGVQSVAQFSLLSLLLAPLASWRFILPFSLLNATRV
jgi:hypothetical protein